MMHRLRSNGVVLGAYANRLTPVEPINVVADSVLVKNPKHGGNVVTAASTDVTPHPLRTDILPEQYYFDFVADWVINYNVRIVGGCCGITPRHIEYLHHKFN
jgi:S-methylmethionine-dependent homocysteine/selenocysteine methylase